jgi:hypothetical protein
VSYKKEAKKAEPGKSDAEPFSNLTLCHLALWTLSNQNLIARVIHPCVRMAARINPRLTSKAMSPERLSDSDCFLTSPLHPAARHQREPRRLHLGQL